MPRRKTSPALLYLAIACYAFGLITGIMSVFYLGAILNLIFLWRLWIRSRE